MRVRLVRLNYIPYFQTLKFYRNINKKENKKHQTLSLQ